MSLIASASQSFKATGSFSTDFIQSHQDAAIFFVDIGVEHDCIKANDNKSRRQIDFILIFEC
ncbi:hypothetical protein LBMAG36_16400 [Chlorobiota bacterium]|nr:hypothetical protein LBMAG36_16400 [Chlorobiota bacterium]